MVSASLDMLEENLVKKIEVMRKIKVENEKQKDMLKDFDEVEIDSFNSILDKKGELIDKLLSLDEGFQLLFDRVKEEVGQNKDYYAEQIKRIQNLIQEITGLSSSIEAAERKNKKNAEEYFSHARQQMNYSRQTSAAAFNYYRTMNNFKDIPPQFLDNKN